MRFILVCLFLSLVSCSKDNRNNTNDNESDWSIDEQFVTGHFSLYPLVLNPDFTSVYNTNLEDNERVGVLNFGTDIVVFPYSYVYNSEIVNINKNGRKYVFTYCPITKSAIAFNSTGIYRASGYLFKDNLTPWDEDTESIWSQMLLKGINGESKNKKLNTIPLLETKWKVVKDNFPSAKVLTNIASYSRFSSPPPLNDDNTNDTNNENAPEQFGKLVYGIVSGFDSVSIFDYDGFSAKKRIDIIVDGEKYLVYGNAGKHIISAFKVEDFKDYELLDDSEFPYILYRSNGKKYNVYGKSPNGDVLSKPKHAFVASWKAWHDLYKSFKFEN